jgi:formamidopyrimidine-DNA glycosylase
VPELPEVDTIHTQLRRRLGESLSDWNFSVDLYHSFIMNGQQSRLVRTQRKGKNICLYGDSLRMHIHLGMSGQLHLLESVKADPESVAKCFHHTRNIFTFYHQTDEDKSFRVIFTDSRKFGKCQVEHTEKPLSDFQAIKELGPDPTYQDEWKWKAFSEAINSHPDMYISSLLMRQDVVAGIGNIYRSEVLHVAKIHPVTYVRYLPEAKLQQLFNVIPVKISQAIALGGCSMADHRSTYRDLHGNRGKMQEKLLVYQRENEQCLTCKVGVVTQFEIEKLRRVFYCPKCQQRVA